MTKLDFPDTPSTGAQYGSSGTVWRWDGTRWATTSGMSSRGPIGAIAYAQNVTRQGPYATSGILGDVAGCSITFWVSKGRRYRISGQMLSSSNVAGDYGCIQISVESGACQNQLVYRLDPGSASGTNIDFIVVANVDGYATYKLQYGRYSGTGSHFVEAGVAYPSFIMAEDITYDAGNVASTTEPGGSWIDLLSPGYLVNGWTEYDRTINGGWPGFRKIGDRVEVRGLLKGGTIGATAFTLPVGYRPPGTQYFCSLSASAAIGEIAISPNGNFGLSYGNNTYRSIECSFSTTR